MLGKFKVSHCKFLISAICNLKKLKLKSNIASYFWKFNVCDICGPILVIAEITGIVSQYDY